MPFESSAVRIWKRLSREERLAAAGYFWRETPEALLGTALGVVVKARRVRPQAARTLPPEARSQALAGVLDPGEPLTAALLVSLHLGERRSLLATFLDAVGLPHEDGVLKEEEAAAAPSEDAVRAGVRALAAAHPRSQVEVYLNTLWLQDPERWASLARTEEWLQNA